MHGAEGHPRFLLDAPPDEGAVMLHGDEAQHALKVLRMKSGDRFTALDGAGHRWLCEVRATSRSSLAGSVLEGPSFEPAPGETGAALPFVELGLAWPRKSRAENMLGPLTQLGAASVRPLRTRFSGEASPPEEAPERWHKLTREAAKQCGRGHLLRFEPPADVAALVRFAEGPATAVLAPRAGLTLDLWLRSLPPLGQGRMGSRARPLRLLVGPEGGFAPEELELLRGIGASEVRLGPHVLRVETAAEAAMAVAGTVLGTVLEAERPDPRDRR